MAKEKYRQGLFKSLRCNWQRQRRKNKQLVLIHLGRESVQIGCWQADCCLWQKTKPITESLQKGWDAWWQAVDEALKDVFIWARVPDMVDTIIVLQQELVFHEELRLPQLEPKELYQAIQWEAEQIVPWTKGSYNVVCASHATYGMELEEEIVQLWAWPKEQAIKAGDILTGLRLYMQGILVGLEADKVQQVWYQGAQLKNWSLQTERQHWQQEAVSLATSSSPKLACIACLLLAFSIYACAKGGCYIAQHQLLQTQQELAKYELWHKRYEQNKRLAATLEQYQNMASQVQHYNSHVGNSLSKLGQQLGASCWLEGLSASLLADNSVTKQVGKDAKMKQEKHGYLWRLEGACYKHDGLERLLERLEGSKQFAQVQLQHSQQDQEKVKFTLAVREK